MRRGNLRPLQFFFGKIGGSKSRRYTIASERKVRLTPGAKDTFNPSLSPPFIPPRPKLSIPHD